MVIRYGFHPRCGETVVVTGRCRPSDGAALTTRHPEGSLAQLPVWMTEDQAATMAVAEFPRLPLACLRELRLEFDACQSSLRDEGRRREAGDKWCCVRDRTTATRPLRARGPTNADCGRRAGEGIRTLDPDLAKVVHTGLQDAASGADLLIAIQAMVAERPEKAAPAGGGMEEMGGIGL